MRSAVLRSLLVVAFMALPMTVVPVLSRMIHETAQTAAPAIADFAACAVNSASAQLGLDNSQRYIYIDTHSTTFADAHVTYGATIATVDR